MPRSWRLLVALGVFVCSAGVQPAPLPAATRPNLVLIMADDMGFSDLGCYGSDRREAACSRLMLFW